MNEELRKIDAYWRAANYLSAAQLYLLDNPLLRKKLEFKDIKKRIVGHWGTAPGQNFIYAHLNRVINKYDLDMMLVVGPGHGGQAIVSNAYLEGTYSEVYPNIGEDIEGLKKLCKQFSFPGGISSHVAPETPGSINEGGELGYSMSHAMGAILDNPNLIAACIVGDGEAETGPLATSWQENKFINPIKDGVVLPILHLNGYKIANPTVLSRISREELNNFLKGNGWNPYFVEESTNEEMHKKMSETMDIVIKEITNIKENAIKNNDLTRPMWPMIVLVSPKGWTGPKEVNGLPIENSFRAHQVPIAINNMNDLELLESWLRSYKPEELFDNEGRLIEELRELCPKGTKRMSANPITNGGNVLTELKTPDFRKYEVKLKNPGDGSVSDMKELGRYIRDLVKLNPNNFRIFGPDEALSNRLNYVFEETNRQWMNNKIDTDEFLNNDGRVMDSMLSEHLCEGWLEGYILTGRHGFFHSYEAFARVIDSMASQHAKWLKVSKELPWRRSISSLNYILTSHIWQQDHNGYTHQDPGFINHLVTKKADITRIYLPPDANCLISCFDHCIKTKDYINVIVASKHERPGWLTMNEAIKHCTKGVSIWKFASNDEFEEPDIVLACCGDTPTLEILASTSILRRNFQDLKIRVVNVVDLMKLESNTKHPHGLTDEEYDAIFTKDKPILFAFHGYPNLIHELTYKRHNQNLHVHGYLEEGTITTPFDMRVQNKIDRYNLTISALELLDNLKDKNSSLIEECKDKLIEHKEYIHEHGIDMPEVSTWTWKESMKGLK